MPSLLRSSTLNILIVFTAVIYSSATPVAGPFRVIPDHFEKCPVELRPKTETIKLFYHGVRDRKDPDLWFYNFNGTTHFTLDDNIMAIGNIASWSTRGGWKDNAYVMKLPRICSTFKRCAPDLWERFMVVTFNDPKAFCPFPPGFYSFNNMSTNFNFKMPPSFYYGKWRATIQLVNSSNAVHFCMRAYGSTAPKLKRKPE
ncbi:uncharacterized protein LOC113212191 [Frankliniella occidentalis]|uniref:Uncharacterized protein LOC113212191 n=1 Tax=Frankliniella occidentalis TaxID=133901 RepID=A0A6J1T4P2_FRAOC|nr:uncharacterized protein LOC113212191 [Frankliniella occidentalis]